MKKWMMTAAAMMLAVQFQLTAQDLDEEVPAEKTKTNDNIAKSKITIAIMLLFFILNLFKPLFFNNTS